jgi:hypothetical protein
LSNIELGRRLGISTNAAWRVQHKLMQAMIERDRRYKLGTAGPRIEINDAYIGGERTGEGAGRDRRGHTPFIIAVETSTAGRPLYARLQVVRGFQTGETKRLCTRVEAGTTVVSDGGQWFRCIAAQPGLVHERHVTGTDRAAARHPAFRWVNTMRASLIQDGVVWRFGISANPMICLAVRVSFEPDTPVTTRRAAKYASTTAVAACASCVDGPHPVRDYVARGAVVACSHVSGLT